MEVAVLNKQGQATGRTVVLPAEIFGVESPNDHAIYLDIKQYLANQRQGTHKSKERAEIAGSTRKIKKQKGTGGARAGSIKSPTFVGGGRIFGPRPKDYRFKLNKKLKRVARKSALTYKATTNNIIVVEDFTMETPQTKGYLAFLKGLAVEGTKTLLVTADLNKNVYLSGRNLPKTAIVSSQSLNTYDILHTQKLILTEGSIAKIEEILK
ncbi:MAG: 50S ribosomal protein L4 [Bacteroidetes bacterium]|nr:MAG: 50S ribosomal protein L4 [Bacteroidota bacterium]TAG85086.1 MAG: 50S ribosomal protein L4 [Bacteroidota bacterium]